MSDEISISWEQHLDGHLKAILEWLALAHRRTGADDAAEVRQQLLLLRESPMPIDQRRRILDLLYAHAQRVVTAELPALNGISLPAPRQMRQRTVVVQELLEILAQEYLNTLSNLFDPQATASHRAPQQTLRRVIQCIAWHIRISHLIAAPNGVGIWQQLHATYRTARRLGCADTPDAEGESSIQSSYIHILLAAIAQPASFSSGELSFITDYIESSVKSLEILETPPQDRDGVFWLDLEQDFPAHALARRPPSSDTLALYFACDLVARDVRQHLAALTEGATAASLGLPAFADTPAGRGVLRRLSRLWGKPAPRRYPRRRQYYRVNLCAGLEQLWQLMRRPETGGQISKWMVTNESPDGYALMHISGPTSHLRVGDIVAVQPTGERAEAQPNWHVGIVRWAISDNPEHIEIGMQQLASQAIAAEVVRPLDVEAGNLLALILPEMPPVRDLAALVAPTGQLNERERRLILLVGQDDSDVREVRPTALTEQTASIEVFSVVPDESR